MYLLSFCLMCANIVIKVCNLTCCLFKLQSWSLMLREGHSLRVFNSSVVRKLGPNIHEVMGRVVKLHYSFVSCLNQIFIHWSNDDIVVLKWQSQRHTKLSWRRKKGKYLVEFLYSCFALRPVNERMKGHWAVMSKWVCKQTCHSL
jgi:hypothetical protein